MGDLIFNLFVGIIAILLIIFISKQKKIKRKQDAIIIIGGAAIIFIAKQPLIWISVFILVSGYFLINSFRNKSTDH